VTPEEARLAARSAASAYTSGDIEAPELFQQFMYLLNDLCADEPLSGDSLRLFQSLELWEVSVGDERDAASERLRETAKAFGK
jgi:hypothetical protein